MGELENVLIRGKGIFDTASSRIQDKAIHVNGDIIEAVDDFNVLLKATEGMPRKIVNLENHYIFPGMINTHVHLEWTGADNIVNEYLSDPKEFHFIRAVNNLRTLAESGVTTVRDCGSGWPSLQLNKAIKKGLLGLLNPRLIVCGPPLTPTGGHLHFMQGEADGVEGCRRAVRERQKRGASSIKIMATGGQMTPGTYPEHPSYQIGELRAIVDQSTDLGLTTVAHCLSAPGTLRALEAGVDCLEHCAFFVRTERGWLERIYDPDVALQIRDGGKAIMMGLSAAWHARDGLRDRGPQSKLERFQLEQEQRMFDIFAKCYELGIRMVCGTDAGVRFTPFDETYLELVLMVKAGLSTADAIKAATCEAAEVLGLGGKVGKIAKKHKADLIAVPENPLEDVGHLKNVDWVMVEGETIYSSLSEKNSV